MNPTTLSHRLSLLQRPASAAKEAAWAFLVGLEIPEPGELRGNRFGDVEAVWTHEHRSLILAFLPTKVSAKWIENKIERGRVPSVSPARVVELVGWVRGKEGG